MDSNIVTVAGVLLSLAIAALLFRLARELYMRERREHEWLAFAERLVVVAAALCLVVIVLALFTASSGSTAVIVSRSATLAALILLVGYVPAILAHYRFIGGRGRPLLRDNPEPLERRVVHWTWVTAVFISVLSWVM